MCEGKHIFGMRDLVGFSTLRLKDEHGLRPLFVSKPPLWHTLDVAILGKYKRVRNNPQVRVAPCDIRGRVTGPEFAAVARILPPEEHQHARQTINRKYWMARLPLIWWRTDIYLELTFP